MKIRNPQRRRAASVLFAGAAMVSAVMLVVSIFTVVSAPSSPAGAATSGTVGSVTPPGVTTALVGGGSETEFVLRLPDGAACTGDTASGNYRVQSYIVPSNVDPGTLQFSGTGPTPAGSGANLRRPLFTSTTTSPFVNGSTDVAPSAGGPGNISGLPVFSFKAFVPNTAAVIPPGTYNLGIACTLGDPGPNQVDKFWNVQFTFSADAGDSGGAAWLVATGGGTTTTTGGGTTTTTDGGTTTTTDGGTTTTTDGGTTTTTDGGTTTTTGGASVSGSGTGGTPSAASPVTTLGQLPYTGSSPLPMVFWAVALLVCGRIAMLLGKRPKVIGDGPTG